MLYLTGDCHGDFGRFSTRRFPRQRELTREDYVLVLGDFGGLWDGSPREEHLLDWLGEKNPTFLFLDGNHENFDRLARCPLVEFQGGMAHRLRPNLFHLCRGYVFQLAGLRCFVMGGAQSHDVPVILAPGERDAARRLRRRGTPFRVEGESWWKKELPDSEQLRRGLDNLAWEGWQVDLVLTHCAPGTIQRRLFPDYPDNALTDFLDLVRSRVTCSQWLCGHYHCSVHLPGEGFRVLYEEIIPAEKGEVQ